MAIMIYPPTAKVVGKNMLKINRTLGIALIVIIADIVLSFIGFAGVGIAAVSTRGAVPMWCVAIPFATFVLGGASLVIIGRKRGLYAGATALWERVRNTEKAAMASFASAQQPVFIEETKRTITKMVEVGLLPEHEIVGECVAHPQAAACRVENSENADACAACKSFENTPLFFLTRAPERCIITICIARVMCLA